MSAPPHVTVVVPTKDRRDSILRCLEALRAQDYPHYDVVVMDNGSSDGTAEAIRELAEDGHPAVHVEVRMGGVGSLRNEGARRGRGEIVAFTDSDCVPAPDWLAEGVAPFANARVGVVQGMTLPDPAVERRPWDVTQEIRELNGRFEACNLFVRREAFLAVGGFDPDAWGWEDTIGGWALLLAGWEPDFAPGAVVHHEVTQPPFGWWLRRGRIYGNAALAVKRHPELRERLLFARYFMRSRDLLLLLALLGLAWAARRPAAIVLTLPYAWTRRPGPKELAYDSWVLLGMLRGSLKHGRLVL